MIIVLIIVCNCADNCYTYDNCGAHLGRSSPPQRRHRAARVGRPRDRAAPAARARRHAGPLQELITQ